MSRNRTDLQLVGRGGAPAHNSTATVATTTRSDLEPMRTINPSRTRRRPAAGHQRTRSRSGRRCFFMTGLTIPNRLEPPEPVEALRPWVHFLGRWRRGALGSGHWIVAGPGRLPATRSRVRACADGGCSVHDPLATAAGAPRTARLQPILGSEFLDAACDTRA